jgi:hypothetical protein
MVSLGTKQGQECRPARERLPAWQGSARLSHEPWETKGHKARGATQGVGEGEGGPHDLEVGHWQS